MGSLEGVDDWKMDRGPFNGSDGDGVSVGLEIGVCGREGELTFLCGSFLGEGIGHSTEGGACV